MAARADPQPRQRRPAQDRGAAARGRRGDAALIAPETEWAPAKLNLHLHVTGRREDGYHTLDSLVVFAGVADRIEAERADGLTLAIDGPFAAGLGGGGDNLVLRAARALRDAAGVAGGARLRLTKNLPVASGIGGGSADAAATLRALARLWRLDAATAVGPALLLGLGADVPVCFAGRPARMGGIGERVEPAPALPPFALVLANPGVAVATPAVFRARTGPFRPPATLPDGWNDARALAASLAALHNDLEAPAIALEARIGAVLDVLRGQPGALLARMSGSGGTCFALFDDPAAAAAAAAACAAHGWWSWAGEIV